MNLLCFFLSISLQIQPTRNEYSVLKGPYTAIVASVIVHVALLLTLIFTSTKAPKVAKEDKANVSTIKSFLYTAPKKIPAKSIIKKTEPLPAPVKKVEDVVPQKVISKPKKQPANAALLKDAPLKNPAKVPPPLPNKDHSQKKPIIPHKAKTNYADLYGLSRLRKKLDKINREQAFAELTQKRSASIMDGEPFPVPKAIIPLSQEQKYKKNTSTNHTGSITKNDNGTCTIKREQMLGSPIEATTSYFACGESKFDKGFREHMKKVRVKLGAKRN